MLNLIPIFLSLFSPSLSLPTGTETKGDHPSACSQIEGALTPLPSPVEGVFGTVPAGLAWDCIQSVPLNQSAALALLDSMLPFLGWQSTLAYIEDPPEEYREKLQDPVDVLGGMFIIRRMVEEGIFKKEHDFGWALYRLLQRTHDGHFVYVPDVIGSIFTWGRPVPIVSVSEDGSANPSIFVYSDILEASMNPSFEPSPIKSIDGQDVLPFLEDFAQYGSLQDRDALWNNVFYGLAQVSKGPDGTGTGTFSGGGRGRWVYPGPTTALKFVNGTERKYENFARVNVDLAGVGSGAELYQKFFTTPDLTISLMGEKPPMTPPKEEPEPKDEPIPAPGYPAPVIRHSKNLIAGYYIDSPGYEDIAVLVVPSFVSDIDAEIEFQDVGDQFLAAAKAAGKRKLVIDVSANGGGTILQGYDLFKKLFPSIDPWGAQRFRAHTVQDQVGQVFSAVSVGKERSMETLEGDILEMVSTPFNYLSDRDLAGEPFDSWAEKFGPHENHGDTFTSQFRWNLSDPLTPYNSGGIIVTGYLNRTGFQQPYEAKDIVVLSDGYCASTCAIFSELMRQQGGVQFIAIGGRARNASAPMQAVGGTKGTNNSPWTYIQYQVETAWQYATLEQRESFANGPLTKYNSYLPFYRASGTPNVNFRDGMRKGDEKEIPLHFIVEESDCRLLYTPDMVVDATATWKAAVDAKWKGKDTCVAGGFGASKEKMLMKRESSKTAKVTTRLQPRSVDEILNSFNIFTNPKVWSKVDAWMQP